MQTKPAGKFGLRQLHQDIDLLDRKIAYCREFERFDSENARDAALRKLNTSREKLVKTAQEAAERGIECETKYLPRSFAKPATTEKEAS